MKKLYDEGEYRKSVRYTGFCYTNLWGVKINRGINVICILVSCHLLVNIFPKNKIKLVYNTSFGQCPLILRVQGLQGLGYYKDCTLSITTV